MVITKYYCPCCKSYGSPGFEIIEKAKDPDNERVRCLKCGWTGERDYCIKMEVNDDYLRANIPTKVERK